MCTSAAPASKASWVDSICCGGVTGTAGLSFFFGTAPVIATVMMTGWDMGCAISQKVNRAVALLPPFPRPCNDAFADAKREPHLRRRAADRRAGQDDPLLRIPAQGRGNRSSPEAQERRGRRSGAARPTGLAR